MVNSWYVSSAKHNAVAQWAALHTYSVGDKVRGLAAPSDDNARVWRASSITTGISGAAEPTWNRSAGSTTTDAGVTWTEVTGNATYGWSAAHLCIRTANLNNTAIGDTIYVGHDHAYSSSANVSWTPFGGSGVLSTLSYIICVNTAGSVPPVAADITTGASETITGNTNFDIDGPLYVYGMTWNVGTGAVAAVWRASQGAGGTCNLDNCTINLVATGAANISPNYEQGGPYGCLTRWNNVTVKFGGTGQYIRPGSFRFIWNGGGVDAGGSAPTNLFQHQAGYGAHTRCQGLDLSTLGSNQITKTTQAAALFEFVDCKLGSSYVLTASTTNYGGNRVEAVNCHSGSSNYITEAHDYLGDLTTETTYYHTGGASDGTTPYSWKIVTSAKANWPMPFEAVVGAVWNDTVSGNVTLTIEIESTATLKDSDIWVDVDYLGSSSVTQSSRASSKSATILTAGSNLSTSSESWAGSLGSAVKQYMQVTFAPRMKGYVYFTVCVAKASQTVYVDPKATLT